MKVIAGLGNPEKKYENTYHNLGFMVADNLAERLGAVYKLKSSLKCALAEGVIGSEKFLIVKPTTYMNLSGECIQKVLSYFGVEPCDLLVIYDDIDIDIGRIRFRPHGSPGTHNGMRNIHLMINTDEFPRVRVGTKPRREGIALVDYVLSKIPESEYDDLNFAIKQASDLAYDYLHGVTFDDLMQRYNKKAER